MTARRLQFAIGLAGAVFFLALAFWRAPLSAVGATLARADPVWLVGAFCVYGANLALRARRWQVILRPAGAVPYPTVARVLLVGYGLNAIMPARLGELFRAEFFKRTYGLPRVPVLTSIVVERLCDGLMVVACLALGLVLAAGGGRSAAALSDAAIAGGALFGAALVAAVGFGRLPLSGLLRRWPRLAAPLAAIGRGLAVLRGRRGLAVAALTLLVYVPDTLTLWLVVKACGLSLGFADTLVLLGAAVLSTLLPSGPGFLGTLQFAFALAVEFAGGSAATGIAAATLVQLCLFLPVAVVATGVFAHGSGTALFDLVRGERAA
jgi:glycosyltransferase 2 family protein